MNLNRGKHHYCTFLFSFFVFQFLQDEAVKAILGYHGYKFSTEYNIQRMQKNGVEQQRNFEKRQTINKPSKKIRLNLFQNSHYRAYLFLFSPPILYWGSPADLSLELY